MGLGAPDGGYSRTMPTLMQRVMRFLNSPNGRRVVEVGRRELSKPANQEKLRRLASRVASSRTRRR
ncbi:hypothetical protein GCM10018962_53760 [Dactylosporangium matsuzakiense]|uniref:Uncharacterized protein n=2 Tax=Dactylosporangium matsuzakiense TaxID=53360 RepID=A0A9W6KS74_9ACTN|nr:hypothetical protein GCM10017581_074360 [Dactylosporangium matsuzakiense]